MPVQKRKAMLNAERKLGTYPEFEENSTPSVDDLNNALPKGQKPVLQRKKATPQEETTAPPHQEKHIENVTVKRGEMRYYILAVMLGIVLSVLILYAADKTIDFFSKFVKEDEPLEYYEPEGYDRTLVPQELFKKDDQELDWKVHLLTVQLKLKQGNGEVRIMSDDDIKYKDGGKLYVVLAGFVFDVSSAPTMYGKDSGYHGFVGRDGSRAFITGMFTDEGLVPNLGGLSPADNNAISDWINFYLNHETYKFVGLHSGWFFDENGEKTWRMTQFEKAVIRAEALEKAQTELDKLFPGCNMQWDSDQGSKLWCSKQSGGISRQWVGFPRSFKCPEDQRPPRCVCVHPDRLADPRVSMYKGCDPKSEICKLPDVDMNDD